MTDFQLTQQAIIAMNSSYSPYSDFKVGAALLSENGKVYLGTNIENTSYSVTNCAERTAFFTAISQGEKSFLKIAVVGGKDGVITSFCPPCGACRQVMSEFCNKDFEIILYNGKETKKYTLEELLPVSFEM